MDAIPTIVELRNQAEGIRYQETEKTLQKMKHLSKEDVETLHRMTNSIINKILHKPTVNLKKQARTHDGQNFLRAIRKLFHLDE